MLDRDMDNDTRGLIMCIFSGIACVAGASIICIDVLVRLIPSKRCFKIQESSAFLASSLSLSFGVMLFSALYSMLPHAKTYLVNSGLSPSRAAWMLLAGFISGFVGIQIISRFLHHHIPSHVVDCDHSHEELLHVHLGRSRTQSLGSRGRSRAHSQHSKSHVEENGKALESTPLLPVENGLGRKIYPHNLTASGNDLLLPHQSATETYERRQSMMQVPQKVMSFVKDTKSNCDFNGPCFGYSDPCGQECFKHVSQKISDRSRASTLLRTRTGSLCPGSASHFNPDDLDGEAPDRTKGSAGLKKITTSNFYRESVAAGVLDEDDEEDLEAQHHHHVPENAFMSIGLQTSIAIALHKLPEGFITYATNHANPSLGLSIFMALFVHNITEGFALALPLFLALNSRWRAMFWASLLGGVSQPLGAGVAAAWFEIAGYEGHKPDTLVYGCMFAITAGIMTSVAMHLFVESLSLNHNRNLCMAFGFIGMSIMGLSNALTS